MFALRKTYDGRKNTDPLPMVVISRVGGRLALVKSPEEPRYPLRGRHRHLLPGAVFKLGVMGHKRNFPQLNKDSDHSERAKNGAKQHR